METATDSAAAANPAITSSFTTTVGNLYADIQTQFQAVSSAASSGETAILSDWARLQAIGPLALKSGYNGFGMTPTQMTDIEASALQGYKLYVMQQLMPVSYQISNYVATTNPVSSDIPSYAQYSYPTFASPQTNTVNIGVVSTSKGESDNPTQQVMETDIKGNGASLFDFYNGLNGWRSMPVSNIQNLNCSGQVATLFNDTPADLFVLVIPTNSYFASPGYNFNSTDKDYSGSDSAQTLELRPYGYLPLYMAPKQNVGDIPVTTDVFDYSWSTSAPVLGAIFASNGSCGVMKVLMQAPPTDILFPQQRST